MNSIDLPLNLEIETLLPSHLEPVRGADDIRAGMTAIREAVDFVHPATVAGMNAGKSLSELMVEIRLPERLLLSETHGSQLGGKVDLGVLRDLVPLDRPASSMRRHNQRCWMISPGLLMWMPHYRWSVRSFSARTRASSCFSSS